MDKTFMFQVLFETVSSVIEITESDKALCYRYFEPVIFPRNTTLEEKGKVPQYQYFVVSGIMRNYFYNATGEAVTTDLNNSPRFFTSYNNFIDRCISDEIIECVTDCQLLRVKRDDLDILFSKSIGIKDFTVGYLEKVFEEERARIKELITLSAEQRYQKLLKNAPNILQQVPLQYIASYLGIKAETLSRIRKKTIS